ncbi:MAG: hypothetical protein ACLURV_02215 [Gallintestinimicrobium sp.]
MSIMAVIAVIGYAFLLISGFLAKTGTLGFALLVLGYMLSNFGQYCYYLIMMISILNTVEYNEYKFRKRGMKPSSLPSPIHHKACLRTDRCPDICNLSAVRRYQLHQPDFFAGAAVHQGLITESEKLDLISGVLSARPRCRAPDFCCACPAALRDDASVLLPL